ncbi:MAG: MBL fold metallo-hydrolase, partial [Moorea sp. SIO2B7]|nr:MBL fold metallo-hydrolase [Moorena sp. SIO2B7]
RLINTHCHIDHVLGNQLVKDRYNLELESHKLEIPVLGACDQVSRMYGIPYKGSPEITVFHEDGDIITFNEHKLQSNVLEYLG